MEEGDEEMSEDENMDESAIGEVLEDVADGSEFEAPEEDVEILETPPPVFMTDCKKKKTLKVREKLDDNFLRHSKRLSSKMQGYKDAASASKAKKTDETKSPNENIEVIDEASPLPIIPPSGSAVAPHLSADILQGIATGFLQIQPESVSAALLKRDHLDD